MRAAEETFAYMITMIGAFFGIMAIAVDAWALQSILFAVQTTNDPGITAGIVAIDGMAVGVIAIGGGAVGLIAVGGGAVGLITLGAGGIGRYVLEYAGLGRFLFTLGRQDREAVELFCRWVPRLMKYVR